MRLRTNVAGAELRAAIAEWRKRIAECSGATAGARFERYMLDTWETTLTHHDDGVFVITGDIPAMWLRDSSAQVWPFLRLLHVPEVRDTLAGIVRQQWVLIARDPYANAFNIAENGRHFDDEDGDLHPGVWERKYEIDSLAFPILLLDSLRSGGLDLITDEIRAGMRAIVVQWRREQRHFELSDYTHVRPSEPIDTLPNEGRGADVAFTGMTWSGFRPSDDACTYGYNIPAQLMAARALRIISEIAPEIADAAPLAAEILAGVEAHGMVGERFAYEVDGYGGVLEMDDANMPSLLSLPLTSDVSADDPRYLATREWTLSDANPFFFMGAHASGIGSPHTPRGYVWHIALAVQGLTAGCAEAERCLATILATDGGTGWTHEGFHPDDPSQFTRPWFSWSNSMACELMMALAEDA